MWQSLERFQYLNFETKLMEKENKKKNKNRSTAF